MDQNACLSTTHLFQAIQLIVVISVREYTYGNERLEVSTLGDKSPKNKEKKKKKAEKKPISPVPFSIEPTNKPK